MASKRKWTDFTEISVRMPYHEAPQRKREYKAPSKHRRYSKISSSKRKHDIATLSNNNSLQVAQQALLDGLEKEVTKNVALSPVSIDSVISVLAVGAEGETLQQLLDFLGFSTMEEANAAVLRIAQILEKSNGDHAPDVSFVSALWISDMYDLNATFANNLRDVHRTEARAVDFNKPDEVVEEANVWVSEQSKGKMNNFLDKERIKGVTMILANALYFKGDWYKTFKPENTENRSFHLLNGNQVQVPFMKTEHEKFDYGTLDGCQVLRMMYKDEGETSKTDKLSKSFSMYVFLPEDKDGLPDLMKNIKLDSSFFKDKVKLKYVEIDTLLFPKFAFECDFSLVKHLKKLVLKLAFDSNVGKKRSKRKLQTNYPFPRLCL